MNFLKITSSNNKAKFPKKKGSTKKGYCRACSRKILDKNKVFYTGAIGIKNECKPCLRKRSRENNRKKAEIIKNNPLW